MPTGDQPWTVASFEPTDAWGKVRPLFEAQEKARRAGFPRNQVGVLKAVQELSVVLQPVTPGELIKSMLIYIDGKEARVRS
ncbi:hypothetical protein [Streptomyces sp. NPDC000229]|uniref:hypothetical protein n=1 Tax=Streptomyces sp. NPDC000229 TaxID=3154247 RepID=UPI0033235B90